MKHIDFNDQISDQLREYQAKSAEVAHLYPQAPKSVEPEFEQLNLLDILENGECLLDQIPVPEPTPESV